MDASGYFVAGLDLGQMQDYTALAILELADRRGGVEYQCRHLQRFPLGTSYPAIVSAVKEILSKPLLLGRCALAVDATGVGRPVVDLLRAAGLAVGAVTIMGGDTAAGGGNEWHVPKRDLISALQVLLQSGRLKFAEGLPEVATLTSELLTYQVKITPSANDTYNAREGAHDDMVLALAVALWWCEGRDIELVQVVYDPVHIANY